MSDLRVRAEQAIERLLDAGEQCRAHRLIEILDDLDGDPDLEDDGTGERHDDDPRGFFRGTYS